MADALPKWIDGLSYTGLSLRRGDLLTGMHDGTAAGARAGVRPGGGGLGVTLAGTTITVAAGVAFLQYQSGQGLYRACLASSTNLTLTSPHATLSRIDLVYLRVWDNAVDASGLAQADVVYLTGTAASSPVAPTPAGTQIYIPLATITVPPSGGGSASVSTAVMPYTVAPGGILPSSSAPPSPYVGQYYDDGSSLRRWTGSAWRPVSPFAPQSSDQVSQPGYASVGVWVDFTSAQWPPITFTVPPSGMAWVTVGAATQNTNTPTATAWASWRASGGYTRVPSETNGVCAMNGRTYASRRVLVSGMTPGASVTLTPNWQVSSAGTTGTVTRISDGQLAVEPVAG